MTTLKQCLRCKELKEPTSENFSKDRRRKDGLNLYCRPCTAALSRERYRADPEGAREKQRQYRTRNRDKENARKRTYRAKNAEKFREQKRRYYRRNIEKEKERLRLIKARKRAEEKARRPPKPPKAVKPKVVKEPKAPLVLEPQLEQAIQGFLNVKVMKSPRTFTWYKHSLHYLAEYLVDNNLSQWPVDPDDINAFLADRHRRGLTDSTLGTYYRAIKAWILWLAKRKKMDREVIELIEKPPKARLLPKVVKAEELAKLLECLKAHKDEDWKAIRDYALIVLALDSGARVGELAALTIDRLDIEQCTFLASDTKSNEDRIITFSDEAAGVLAEWLSVRSTLEFPAELKTVFVSFSMLYGWVKLPTDGMRHALSKAQERAGIPPFNFHRLRASYAVFTLRARGDLLDVQRQMGHVNLATTQRYAMVDDAGRRERHNKRNPLDYLKGLSA